MTIRRICIALAVVAAVSRLGAEPSAPAPGEAGARGPGSPGNLFGADPARAALTGAALPSAQEQAQAEKLIKQAYQGEYARRPTDRRDLAAKLVRQAGSGSEEPATRYVLYREAANAASASGDYATAKQAIDALARTWAVDANVLRQEAMTAAARVAAPADLPPIVAEAMGLTDQAVAADDYEAARRWVAVAESTAAKAGDQALAAETRERAQEVRSSQEEFFRVKGAFKTLEGQPDDPRANAAAGRFLCFVKGDWEKGLPMLAKGADAPLKKLATRDVAGASTTEDRLAIGDAWRDYAKSQPASARRGGTTRAQYWYLAALHEAKGLARVAVLNRLRGMPGGVSFAQLAADFAGPQSGTKMSGGESANGIADVSKSPGLLVGLSTHLGNLDGHAIIRAVAPVYLTEAGEVTGPRRGMVEKEVSLTPVVAKPGYAVGAVITDGTQRLNGFKIVFMRVHGVVLDPDDRYESNWVGGHDAKKLDTLGGDGRPVIGIRSRSGSDVDVLGLIQLGEDPAGGADSGQ